MYVYDDGHWLKLIDASLPNLPGRVTALETAINNVYTKAETDTAIATAVAGANHLTYETATSLDNIDPTASSS